jgi:MFS family permease
MITQPRACAWNRYCVGVFSAAFFTCSPTTSDLLGTGSTTNSPPMLQTVTAVSALFLSLVLLISGSTMLGTLLGLRLELEGYTAARTGLILAFHSIGFVLGSLYTERIIRRVGHIRAFAVFGALACSAILTHPMYVHADLWIVLRLLVGFSIAGLLLIVESWVNGVATAQTRGTLLGFYLILFYLAAAGGQLMIGLGNAQEFYLFSVAAILVALSLVPLSLTRAVAPQLPEATRVRTRDVLRKAPLAVIGALLSGVAMSAFNMMGPIYATRIGLDISKLSLFMSVTVLSAMLFQWPIGRMSDFMPRNRVVLGLAVAGLGASSLTAFWGEWSIWLLFASAALYVGFASTVYMAAIRFSSALRWLRLDGVSRQSGTGTRSNAARGNRRHQCDALAWLRRRHNIRAIRRCPVNLANWPVRAIPVYGCRDGRAHSRCRALLENTRTDFRAGTGAFCRRDSSSHPCINGA